MSLLGAAAAGDTARVRTALAAGSDLEARDARAKGYRDIEATLAKPR